MSSFSDGSSGSTAAATATEELDLIPYPEVGADATTVEGGTNFAGASFIIHRPASFNRIAIRLNSIPALATALGRFLLYQQSDGGISDSVPLVASFDFSATEPPADVTITSALNEGTVELAQGVCWALWGSRTGSSAFDVSAYDVFQPNNNYLLAINVESGTHPVTFTTSISADTTPSTLNPLAGGGTVTGADDDKAIVWRAFTV